MTARIGPEGRKALDRLRELLDTPEFDVTAAERSGRLPPGLLRALGEAGLLLPTWPADGGRPELSQRDLGALCEELGGRWVSLLSVVTAHAMAAEAVRRWAARETADTVLPAVAEGRIGLSFALSEPETGSDAAGVRTRAEPDGDGYRLTGVKTWLSGGQQADAFLVLAASPQGPVTALVDRENPHVRVEPLDPLLGFRSAALATLTLDGVAVPAARTVGRPGSGLTHVASTALDHGRYRLAWGGVGLAQAALRASAEHALTRRQFGAPLLDHQLVRAKLSDMVVEVAAARLLCAEAARLREERLPEALVHTSMAKYRAARTAAQSARDAVQLHGAAGCSPDSAVERYFRDAKLLEIIEGTEQIHQITIAGHIRRFLDSPADR
ncbi:acyl-CoA dehydrogenase family protein [Streptomyces sioyaensis]|uniref:acyl-CoA dehydrogenase family protein n=1 Tax=Streptomyces sioyaensis TaxID=67364 RepID=UPI0037B0E479